jgi:signal transduction histidine kinase
MSTFTVQSLFLLYSSISLLTACLLTALFWKKYDFSAKLWIYACLLTFVATSVTVFRTDIPLLISYSLMVTFEALSILLMGKSLQQLGTNSTKSITLEIFYIPVILFGTVEYLIQFWAGTLTPQISAIATTTFGVCNLIAFYQCQKVSNKFENKVFFQFLNTCFIGIAITYFIRGLQVLSGHSGLVFDPKVFNIVIWLMIILFGVIRNLAYIVLRLHLGFSEHSRLNNMNLKLKNILDERNEMILSIERLNKSASINALASTVAHEINQPLGASKINAQFAKIKLESTPINLSLIKELVDNILLDIERAANIVRNLSRLAVGNKTLHHSINLLKTINSIHEISKSKLIASKIDLEINCSSKLSVVISASEFQQVLINLLNNSIQVLNSLHQDSKKISIDCSMNESGINIFISDNGPGITVGDEEKIFELLRTNKPEGTGIGLWLTRNIIERAGGSIQVKKQNQPGACFVINLRAE